MSGILCAAQGEPHTKTGYHLATQHRQVSSYLPDSLGLFWWLLLASTHRAAVRQGRIARNAFRHCGLTMARANVYRLDLYFDCIFHLSL